MTQLVRWGEDMRDNNYYVYFYKAPLKHCIHLHCRLPSHDMAVRSYKFPCTPQCTNKHVLIRFPLYLQGIFNRPRPQIWCSWEFGNECIVSTPD